ncbi:MAG: AraC family transcriptional regulator [Clostridia bacterium]|nr:AraC family transcriptional regulator [Clostridia bacterium]
MYTVFSENNNHLITEANINFYASPFVHPKRKMKDHDFIYILQGEWKFGQNDEEFTAKKDNILILSANNTHFGISPCLPNTKTMYFHVKGENDFTSNIPQDGLCINSLCDVSSNSDIKKYFSEIVNCYLQGKQKKADIFFNLLLYELCQPVEDTENNIPLRIKKIVHNSPEKFFSNAYLAKKCNVSVKTAETKFKEAFGITIHQYMLDFKITEAITYFKNFPEITVKEVAFNLGFYDEYHFSKQFKKIMRTSPTEYKLKIHNL